MGKGDVTQPPAAPSGSKSGRGKGPNRHASSAMQESARGGVENSSTAATFSPTVLLTVPEEYRLQLRQAFDMFDTSGKGHIQSHEVLVALYALGYNVDHAELGELLQEAGAKDAAVIDFNEFYTVLLQKMMKKECRSESVRAFKQIDKDDKATISLEDLRMIADSLQMDLTDDELAEMISFAHSLGYRSPSQGAAEFDAKDEMCITEEEFLRLMKRANVF